MKKNSKERLRLWQERLAANETAYAAEQEKMSHREDLYSGVRSVSGLVKNDKTRETPHVRNICAEIIEAQVSSEIPKPKVTARRKKDEAKAKLIEDMLRNELDRLPFEALNDMAERTSPIQGGVFYHVEWDNAARTHQTVGELSVSLLHPLSVVPQDGIFSGIEDMDYVILKIPQTKEYIRLRYGVDITGESEAEPEVRGSGSSAADDLVTQYIAYYRADGGIGLFSWCGDAVLEDLEDYQARRLRRCAKCGALEPLIEMSGDGEAEASKSQTLGNLPVSFPLSSPDAAIDLAEGELTAQSRPRILRGKRGACPYCGERKWEESREDYEELYVPVMRSDGTTIGGMVTYSRGGDELDGDGLPIVETVTEPMRIPYYKPDIFPVLLQKNVSVHGKLLGGSDIDRIEDHQNTTNRMEAKIIDKLLRGGSYLTLPIDAKITVDSDEIKKIMIKPEQAGLIGVYTAEADISQDMAFLAQVYEEARQGIGITDSFQGRRDTSANSGKAKEFAAAQSAGRLESKRVMKEAAYAALFEAMFKFKLAYADEPRPVVSHDLRGNPDYEEFNRYDFLEQDDAGEWYWNDQFLFSCDTSAPLASNRDAMWQETRSNFASGTFGDPTNPETLIMFWSKMAMLHYPGAEETKSYLEDKLREERMAAMQASAMSAGGMVPGEAQAVPGMGGQATPAYDGAGSADEVITGLQ